MHKQTHQDKQPKKKKVAARKAGDRTSTRDAKEGKDEVAFDERDTIEQPAISFDGGPKPRTEVPPGVDPLPDELEGEGSYAAGRKYDEDVRDFVGSGEVEAAASDAARAVDEDEEGMREAEAEAKKGPRH